MKLSPRQREILTLMVENKDSPEGELVQSIPGGWWLGNQRIAGKTAFHFLRNCVIDFHRDGSENFRIHRASSYTKKALEDPKWEWEQEREVYD